MEELQKNDFIELLVTGEGTDGEGVGKVDGKTVSSVRVVPGTILKCGDFSLVFSGDLVDSGKLLLWRIGRGKAQYASLGYGANLIGSGSECRCVIEAPGIPALLAPI